MDYKLYFAHKVYYNMNVYFVRIKNIPKLILVRVKELLSNKNKNLVGKKTNNTFVNICQSKH